MSVVGFPSEESPVVGVRKIRERLGSSRVSMKNDKTAMRIQESLWRAHGLGEPPGHGCPSRRS